LVQLSAQALGVRLEARADKELSDKVNTRFLVASDENQLLSGLTGISQGLPDALQFVAEAFNRNIRGLVAAVTIPFRFASASIRRERYGQLHIAERIRSKNDVDAGASEEEAERRAVARANSRFDQEMADPAQTSELADRTCKVLLDAYEVEMFALGAQELLRQSVVLAWGAFEVLARDLLCAYLNERPDAARELAVNAVTSKLFSFKKIDFDVLAEFEFDLSSRMGDFVTYNNNLSSIEAIRAVYKSLSGDSQDLVKLIQDERLWKLCKSRHLIVHRRGIIDQKYIDETGSPVSIGATLNIAPCELETYIQAVEDAAGAMLRQIAGKLDA
jgi:hypothetical protein